MPNAVTKAVRFGHLLSVGLLVSSLCRMCLTVYPAYDVYLPVVGNACGVFVLLVWFLMPAVFLMSTVQALTLFNGFADVRRVLAAVITDPSYIPQVLAVLAVKAYEIWLICFIYQRWTVDFSLLVQLLQFLPATTLFLHSFCQLFVIAACDRYGRSERVTLFAEFQVSINIAMLGHLLFTVVVVYCHEPCELNDIAVLVISELVFRILVLAAFLPLIRPRGIQAVVDGRDVPAFVYAPPTLPSPYTTLLNTADCEEFPYLTVCHHASSARNSSSRSPTCRRVLRDFNRPAPELEELVFGKVDVYNMDEDRASLSMERTLLFPEARGDVC